MSVGRSRLRLSAVPLGARIPAWAFLAGFAFLPIPESRAVAQTLRLPLRLTDSLRTTARPSARPFITGLSGTRSLAPHTTAVLRPGEFLRSDTAAISTVRNGTLQQVLPVRYYGPDASGHRMLKLAPVVVVEQGAMRMRPDGSAYATDVLVGVRDELSPSERIALPPQMEMQLSVSGGEVGPSEVVLLHTNPPFERVKVSSAAPPDTLRLRLDMSFGGAEVVTPIPVQRASVLVSAPPRLPGWGVGRTNVTVGISEDGGERVRTVTLRSSAGTLESLIVHVNPDVPREVSFRTEGMRRVTISGKTPGLNEARTVIDLVSPMGFFAASFVGGLLGALLKALFTKKRSPTVIVRHALGGVLMGVMAAAAFLFDVNLTQLSVKAGYNEIVIALVATAGSIGVLAILSGLSGNVRQALEGRRP